MKRRRPDHSDGAIESDKSTERRASRPGEGAP